jgi:hypothetical protein
MKLRIPQIKPTSRVYLVSHMLLLVLLPLAAMAMIYSGFTLGAVLLVLISKWRIFAVRPRYWLANIRANSVDIFVNFSILSYLHVYGGGEVKQLQLFGLCGILYGIWLTVIKPRTSDIGVIIQGYTSQILALSAIYTHIKDADTVVYMIMTWLVSYVSVRHICAVLTIDQDKVVGHVWALFSAIMSMILSRWLIVYGGIVPQITIVLGVISYGFLHALYVMSKGVLVQKMKLQLTATIGLLLLLVVVLSDWQFRGI